MSGQEAMFEWQEFVRRVLGRPPRVRRGVRLAFEPLEPRQMLAADGFACEFGLPPEPDSPLLIQLREMPQGAVVGAGLEASRATVAGPEILYLEELARAVGDAFELDGDDGSCGPGVWQL